MEEATLTRLSALAHPGRVAVYKLLVRRYPDAVPAGKIAQALGLKPSTLSVYLSTLGAAGLVGQERAGTSLRYTANVAATGEIVSFLLQDCCKGRPEACQPLLTAQPDRSSAMTDRTYSVLFICTGNSARSIFAETLLRDMGGDRFRVYSAGTRPYSQLNPLAVAVLKAKGHDISPLRAKHVCEFTSEGAPEFDFVFTVCDQAANEDCPAWHGQPISAHWGMPDPLKATGTEAEKSLAFQHAYGALRNRIAAFTALPLDTLDRLSLQAAVDDIARSTQEVSA